MRSLSDQYDEQQTFAGDLGDDDQSISRRPADRGHGGASSVTVSVGANRYNNPPRQPPAVGRTQSLGYGDALSSSAVSAAGSGGSYLSQYQALHLQQPQQHHHHHQQQQQQQQQQHRGYREWSASEEGNGDSMRHPVHDSARAPARVTSSGFPSHRIAVRNAVSEEEDSESDDAPVVVPVAELPLMPPPPRRAPPPPPIQVPVRSTGFPQATAEHHPLDQPRPAPVPQGEDRSIDEPMELAESPRGNTNTGNNGRGTQTRGDAAGQLQHRDEPDNASAVAETAPQSLQEQQMTNALLQGCPAILSNASVWKTAEDLLLSQHNAIVRGGNAPKMQSKSAADDAWHSSLLEMLHQQLDEHRRIAHRWDLMRRAHLGVLLERKMYMRKLRALEQTGALQGKNWTRFPRLLNPIRNLLYGESDVFELTDMLLPADNGDDMDMDRTSDAADSLHGIH